MTRKVLVQDAIPLNIPTRLKCLRTPIKWQRKFLDGEFQYTGTIPAALNRFLPRASHKLHGRELFIARQKAAWRRTPAEDRQARGIRTFKLWDGIAWPFGTYDPWEKRGEFLRIKENDHDALFAFLEDIGAFDDADDVVAIGDAEYDPDIRRTPTRTEAHFWETQKWIKGEMQSKKGTNFAPPFSWFNSYFITDDKRNAGLMIRTTSFRQALSISVVVDRLLGAKVRKCKRPDCSALFSTTSNQEQKYCRWYCGHIETVRRKRKAAKKLKKGR